MATFKPRYPDTFASALERARRPHVGIRQFAGNKNTFEYRGGEKGKLVCYFGGWGGWKTR